VYILPGTHVHSYLSFYITLPPETTGFYQLAMYLKIRRQLHRNIYYFQ